jgi:hypothetical protein
VTVNRGPSLASTIIAIDAAAELDAKARLEREEAYRRWSEETFPAGGRGCGSRGRLPSQR